MFDNQLKAMVVTHNLITSMAWLYVMTYHLLLVTTHNLIFPMAQLLAIYLQPLTSHLVHKRM
jgi:hypothetical protein